MSRDGWLPPGCSYADLERACGGDMPPECEECDLYNDILNTCPYDGLEGYCHKLSLITQCGGCGKPLCKVQGVFKQEEIAYGYEAVFCCSPECAKQTQTKIDEEFEKLERGDGDIIEETEAENKNG